MNGMWIAIGAFLAWALGSSARTAPPGSPPMTDPDTTGESPYTRAVRRCAVALARAALGPVNGPQWQAVTQGRTGSKYSNCGDLPHAVYWWIGCRHAGINREDRTTGRTWKSGNIAELRKAFEAAKGWHLSPAPSDFRPGDTFLIGTHPTQLEHVGVVLSRDGNVITSGEYGKGPMGNQPGELCTRTFHKVGSKWAAEDGRILVARMDVGSLALSAPAEAPVALRSSDVDNAIDDLRAAGGPNA